MTYSTQADLEKYLQADFLNDPDGAITLLLEYAKGVIDEYIGRELDADTGIVETFDGNRDAILFLSRTPVTAVNSVTEDDIALVADVDFVWYSDGRLVRGSPDSGWRWTWRRQGVVVNYDGGYSTIPKSVQMVSTRIAGRIFQASAAYANTPIESSGLRSVSLDGSDSVEFVEAVSDVSAGLRELDEVDKRILGRYVRQVF